MVTTTPKARHLTILCLLLITTLSSPTVMFASGIIVADLAVLRTDASGSSTETGTLVVEDDVILLVTQQENIAFQSAPARSLIKTIISSDPPQQGLAFSITQTDDDTQLILSVTNGSDYVIIEDYIVL
ncbi:MAG: hypothetical protein AAF560_29165 [Acidobacteriota bacterium]